MAGADLIVYGGSQREAMRIARALRGAGVYCEIAPEESGAEVLVSKQAKGVIFTGDESVFREECLLAVDIPVLCIGMCSRALIRHAGGEIGSESIVDKLKNVPFLPHPIFEGTDGGNRHIQNACHLFLPPEWKVLSGVDGVAMAFCDPDDRLFGVQFSMEQNDYDVLRMLANFAIKICRCPQNWSMERYARRASEAMKEAVGDAQAAVLLSGGVDSTVCAALARRTFGERLHCYYVHTGLSRFSEHLALLASLEDVLKVEIHQIDAQDRIFEKLRGVGDVRSKRKAVEETISAAFREEIQALEADVKIIETDIYEDGFAVRPQEQALHPLQPLFKAEVREMARLLQIPDSIVNRPSFPQAGLALRCVGEVTRERIDDLRAADSIFVEEVEKAQMQQHLTQYCALLLHVLSGREETYQDCILLYATQNRSHEKNRNLFRMPYEVLERTTQRIYEEVPSVSRVMYDLSGTGNEDLEWE